MCWSIFFHVPKSLLILIRLLTFTLIDILFACMSLFTFNLVFSCKFFWWINIAFVKKATKAGCNFMCSMEIPTEASRRVLYEETKWLSYLRATWFHATPNVVPNVIVRFTQPRTHNRQIKSIKLRLTKIQIITHKYTMAQYNGFVCHQ